MTADPPIQIRTFLLPGDLGRITELHGALYAREQGWNAAFEAFVAESLGRFILEFDPGTDRLWIAETDGRLVGCIAIAGRPDHAAQLRFFLVHPSRRGSGLGRRLLGEALAFCRQRGARSVFLWTAAGLPAAEHLYLSAGFRLTEEHAQESWGRPVVERRYDLRL